MARLETVMRCVVVVLGGYGARADARACPGMPADTLSLSEVRRAVEGRYEGRILQVRVDTPRSTRAWQAAAISATIGLAPRDARVENAFGFGLGRWIDPFQILAG